MAARSLRRRATRPGDTSTLCRRASALAFATQPPRISEFSAFWTNGRLLRLR